MTDLDKLIKSKIFFFKGTRHDCKNLFDTYTYISKEVHGENSGILNLKKANEPIAYDSKLEKSILEDLDNCVFVKRIKTQSLAVSYKSKIGNKIKTYIPDIQLLLVDNSIVIIEVKPFREMVNSKVLRKHKALRKYCKENGFGFAIIGEKYYSFEDLKKETVDNEIQEAFINYVNEHDFVTFSDCSDFKKKYKINEKQICNIIWKNKKRLKYQQFKIKYINGTTQKNNSK